jgi:hypothetical protein
MPRPSEAGKIKVGCVVSRKGKGGKLPQKFESKDGPYFMITKTLRGHDDAANFIIDAKIMKELEQYADKDSDGVMRLRQIPIRLDSDIIEQIAPTRLAMYKGTNLFCAGTGDGKEAATRWTSSAPGQQVSTKVDCPCEFLRARGDEKCKPNLILWCTIDAGGETRLGVRHAFRTTGWNSIKSILAGLELIQEQVGTLRGPKFWLCVKWDLKKDATGQSRRVPVAYIECRTNDLSALRRDAIMTERTRLEVVRLRDPAVLSLPAPAVDESKATQAAVTAEWYPTPDAARDQPDDGDEDDDEAFYNPETGEVYEDEDDGERPTVTPQMAPKEEPNPEPKAEPVEATDPPPRWHKVLGPKLAKLVEIRGLDKGQQSMKEVLEQLTTDKFGEPIPFMKMTTEQAAAIDLMVEAEIKKKADEVWVP